MQATEKGRAQIQLLRDQHERLKDGNRACLWRNDSEAARVVASMNWDWKPAVCKLGDLSFENLPTWLKSRGAKLRFYGDSLNNDMALQLISRGGFLHNSSVPVDMALHDSSFLVNSYRKDHLGALAAASLIEVQEKSKGGMESFLDELDLPDVPWADENISSADILVLNAGAHWSKSVEHTRVAFTKVARELWELPQHKQPRAVIFRTTVMGHDKCAEFLNPLQAEEVAENKRASKHQYNWRSFSASNAAIIQAFKDVWPAERFRALDISMFEQRGDGHNAPHNGKQGVGLDCLHYCVPGPSMVWNQLLLHVLSQLPL